MKNKSYLTISFFTSLLFIFITNFSFGTDLDVVITVSKFPSGTDISCHGAHDGSMEAVIVGGTAPYSYQWTSGSYTAFTKTISNLGPGEYFFTVIDGNNDTVTKSGKIYNVDALTTNPELSVYQGGYNISYQGGDDGSIHTNTSGGTPPYSFLWNNNLQEENIEQLTAGTYSVTITDDNQCVLTMSVTLTQPTPLHVVSITSPLYHGYNIKCNGSETGSINLTVNGGVPPYTYYWNSGDTTKDLDTLKVGTFTVQITDANNAHISRSITLTQPPALEYDLAATVYSNGKNTSCFNCSDGYITNNANGGVSPYTYLWNTGQTTANLSGVIARNYSLIVTDVNGCSKTKEISLSQPDREDWTMIGNAGTNPTSQYIGTSDSTDFVFRTNGIPRFKLKNTGEINFPSFSGTTPGLIYNDSLGNLKSRPFSLGGNCSGTYVMAWKQSPVDADDVFSCSKRFGIGMDHPRERLDVKGSIIASNWTDEENFIKIQHDGGNSLINSFGLGHLSINSSNDTDVFQTQDTYINTGSFSGDVQIGNSTHSVRITGPLEVNEDFSAFGKVKLNTFGTGTFDGVLSIDNTGQLSKIGVGTQGQFLSGTGQWVNLPNYTSPWLTGSGTIFSDPGTSRIGIGTSTPWAKIQVGNGLNRLCIDNAVTLPEGWLTSYVGGNFHQEANGDWVTFSNNTSNGAGVLTFSTGGTIRFISIPTHDAALGNQTLSNHNFLQATRMRITTDGKVAIGTSWDSNLSSDFKLFVLGGIRTDKIQVDIADENDWADYVFQDNYDLMSLKKLGEFIRENKHLPGLPTAKEALLDGVNVVETQRALLQKVEELTLYVLQLKEENIRLSGEIEKLK